ncbi:FMN-binding negative transcriptional regulator [Elioraea tepidiphila]|jgi:transcriptional regulator|uniref:FMN-binding negative transcriptional regulator n=1 Tax=Elioraea tepidiphila TaxID=457934 RepID=UPI000476584D|nr:FMN-binding negative transcriptional regulator [Elioraea tepidiphila]
MYAPPSFRVKDPEELRAMIAGLRFATMVVNGPEGPVAAHLPMVADATRPQILLGHVARANPIVTLLREAPAALACFVGPGAYVTPAWYASKREHGKVVPTWNYIAVHARGRIEPVDDAGELRAIVAALTDAMEADRPEPWAVEDAPADFLAGMLKAIFGFRLHVTALEGSAKLSQNRPAADHAGVVEGLVASPLETDRLVGALMRKRRQ